MKKSAFVFSPLLQKTTAAHHGALNHLELESMGVSPDQVIDFSSNINPFGPPSIVKEILPNVELSSYPDRNVIAFRRALANQIGVDLNQIVVGNGTSELIWLIAFAFVKPGDRILVIGPTFGEYQRCVRLMGGQVIFVNACPEKKFNLDYEEVDQALNTNQPGLCFICNPNNPTGTIIPLETIQSWAQTYPDTGFILDEAYLPFTTKSQSAITLSLPNLIILCSMTKDYSLAGVRLGFAVGPEEDIDKISQIRPAWNVNALAQAAGLEVLKQKHFMMESNQKIRIEKQKLVFELEELGFSIPPSETHYFIVEVGEARKFRLCLLRDHLIQVRDCTSFGLPSYVRISTRKSEDNKKLISAIKDIIL